MHPPVVLGAVQAKTLAVFFVGRKRRIVVLVEPHVARREQVREVLVHGQPIVEGIEQRLLLLREIYVLSQRV
jgi:hypothetical protein